MEIGVMRFHRSRIQKYYVHSGVAGQGNGLHGLPRVVVSHGMVGLQDSIIRKYKRPNGERSGPKT